MALRVTGGLLVERKKGGRGEKQKDKILFIRFRAGRREFNRDASSSAPLSTLVQKFRNGGTSHYDRQCGRWQTYKLLQKKGENLYPIV